ncbi:hypothetical protein HS041_20515 [Planomonospora sp. ID67723]|uniref:DUF6153 family protein n=1 Tax=Planomonospora sp. ID67723 TaxID=2738134 RepID=UPI0018C39EC3|nr:DUF6153 family protein [Planomonospora sp. ID67723]MBG0830153.1 hypothetical protein [Planomonospora sp. ID67723]
MDDSTRRSAVRAGRWTLLLALVLGVAGMHTLGHLDHERRHDGVTASGHAPAAGHGHARAHLPPATADGTQPVSGLGDLPAGFDPTSVCLAVLASVLLVVAGALWAWIRRASEVRAAGVRPALFVARPPPRRTALRLARLCVLRI